MPGSLPPAPINEPAGSFAWQQWYSELTALYSAAGAIPWTAIDTTGSNITDIATRTHNNLQTIQGGTSGEYYHLTSAQHALLIVTAAGTYTPTRSAEVNQDANATMFEAQYLRVGATVTVSGRFTFDPTLTATATSFEMTLPIASNIGAVEDLSGVAFCGAIASMGAAISGSVANNTAVVQWISSDVTAQSWSFTFTYQII